MTERHTVVFTDLDGTLLDHDNYSFAAAAPALQRLHDLAVPWVLNTSKTRAELMSLKQRLNNPWPVIVENGAAVVIPAGGAIAGMEDCDRVDGLACYEFAPRREQVLTVIHGWRQQQDVDFCGFADWDEHELSDISGLPLDDARLALNRNYSEPILWQDSDDAYQDFLDMLAEHDLQALSGGRFIHIMGQCDKGTAMRWLAPRLIAADSEPRVVAFGDSDNDLAMLQAADIAVVVRRPHRPPLDVVGARGEVVITEDVGPLGWNNTLLALLDKAQ